MFTQQVGQQISQRHGCVQVKVKHILNFPDQSNRNSSLD